MSEVGEFWIDEPGGTKARHWIDLIDPEGWYKASVKWDGCVHFRRAYNLPYPHPEGDDDAFEDYIHICDLDEFIARLQALKQKAIEHFGGDWPQL